MKDIRQLLNMSQDMLANYMGISRALLAYTEHGKRSLPASALHRANQLLAVIYKKHKSVPSQVTVQIGLQTKALNKMLQARLDLCKVQLTNAQVTLKELDANYNSCIARLQLVNELLPTLTNNAQGRKDKAWLKLLEVAALNQLKTCGPKAKQSLLLQIELLELEIEAVRRRLG